MLAKDYLLFFECFLPGHCISWQGSSFQVGEKSYEGHGGGDGGDLPCAEDPLDCVYACVLSALNVVKLVTRHTPYLSTFTEHMA